MVVRIRFPADGTQREGKIFHSALGNRAVGARGLAKGEFITKS